MEFSRSGQKSLGHSFPKIDGGFNNDALGGNDFLTNSSTVFPSGHNSGENGSINILDRTDGGRRHVDGEEMSHHSGRNTVSSTSRVPHGCSVLDILIFVETTSFFRNERVKTTLLHHQSNNF
jgi:hypothetical protein